MSIFTTVRTDIRASTVDALSDTYPTTPIIFSHQNGEEPAVTYIDIQEINTTQIGRTQTSTRTTDVTVEGDLKGYLNSQNHYEITIQYSVTGSQSGDIAHDLHHLLNTTPVWEKFQLNNLYPIRKSDVRRAPILRETQWIDRYNFDVTFTYSVVTEQIVDVVEYATFEYNPI
tara:strand:+ start:28443 stop:28958 length:516 start_codon:yes stop_codon:yes gene_type:complete